MNSAPAAVLLDTCAVIWLAEGVGLSASIVSAIIYAGLDGACSFLPFPAGKSAYSVGTDRGGRRCCGVLKVRSRGFRG
jgi:hypothetical protein